ncbi:LytR C-terminal domain-containing protein [Umezawaea endophytica]|uniref:LytR C-terminal domain-containing protein n=1 Tax=Umezawaea endophytica TaxID=1654476 RepID=A0A9X2VMI5_9PSEU|nr:LytR C-terminal domain-containing protein [Umezawaea endophytica]MCS7478869.1 LytR C-terminal domain-containing protein [Umezawaea endophytica]
MSSPDSPSTSHPARAAGFALLGVALVALVIGVFTLFTGSDGDQTATGSSSSQPPPASGTSSESVAPPASTEPPAATTSAPTTTTETAPPASSAAAPTGATTPPPDGQPTVAKPPVRVYNNSTISGLAARVAEDVERSGWTVAGTGNYSQGQIPTTTVYYRPGTDEEESAKALAAVMQARVEARFDGIQDAHDGIIVIVTNDYKGALSNKK